MISTNDEKTDSVVHAGGSDNYLQRLRSSKYRSIKGKINQAGRRLNLKFDTSGLPERNFEPMPSAILAASTVVTKSVVEADLLKDITSDMTKYGGEQLSLDQWKKIAELTKTTTEFDEQSIAFIRRKTAGNNLSEEQFQSLINNLAEFVTVDTVRNEFLMRMSLLVWLNTGLDKNIEELNRKIYAELFLTPDSDKWLGLYSPDIYSAIEGNGIVQ